MTLHLPLNFLPNLHDYVFGHNKTHMSLALDYGSLINHHESFNVGAIGPGNVYFRVRFNGFQFVNRNVSKSCSIYTCIYEIMFVFMYMCCLFLEHCDSQIEKPYAPENEML